MVLDGPITFGKQNGRHVAVGEWMMILPQKQKQKPAVTKLD